MTLNIFRGRWRHQSIILSPSVLSFFVTQPTPIRFDVTVAKFCTVTGREGCISILFYTPVLYHQASPYCSPVLEFPLLMPRLVDRTTKLDVITHMRSISRGQPLDERCGLFLMLHVYIQENGLGVVLINFIHQAVDKYNETNTGKLTINKIYPN